LCAKKKLVELGYKSLVKQQYLRVFGLMQVRVGHLFKVVLE
jgi:hypothetical protein